MTKPTYIILGRNGREYKTAFENKGKVILVEKACSEHEPLLPYISFDFKTLEIKEGLVEVKVIASRSECFFCAPTPVAQRIIREHESQKDRKFLSKVLS